MIRRGLVMGVLERRPLKSVFNHQSPLSSRAYGTRASRQRRRRNGETNSSAVVRKESTSNKIPASSAVERASSSSATSFQLFAWYSRALDSHPILTKCVSSGLVSASGDVAGQYIAYKRLLRLEEEGGQQSSWAWDALRTGRFALLGFALVAPVCHLWYASLMERFPGQAFVPICKRVLLDQFFFAPLFVPTWLVNLWMLEQKSPDYVLDNLPKAVPPMVVASWQLWIPAQTVNLGFVPGKYQVLFSNVVAVAWNTFLSLTTQDPKALREEVAADEGEQASHHVVES